MVFDHGKFVRCSEFEGALIEYLDGTLPRAVHTSLSRHVLQCPICHDLLNEVKNSVDLCREISVPTSEITRLEARILSTTAPFSSMSCDDFEEHLTVYLDGFLPAGLFHRWERHLVTCPNCTDLPGAVVRTIGACLTIKDDDIPVPHSLHDRIFESTTGKSALAPVRNKISPISRVSDWAKGIRFPNLLPQLAPVAMIAMLAVLFFSEMVTNRGSVPGIYSTSFELAMQSYDESSELMRNQNSQKDENKMQPVEGTFVSEGER